MTKIKICGLRRVADMEAANRVKPDYIGFVFAEKSRRKVTKEEAASLKAALDPHIPAVGVFVNAPVEEAAALCREGIIDIVQLHGDEDRAYIAALKVLVPNPIIKAVRVQSTEQILEADKLPCDMLLLDTYDPHAFGGTGKTFDYTLIPPLKHPFFLAGGLNADNVMDAIQACAPACVDVSGGVETDGFKDEAKMQKIVELVHKAAPGSFGS